MAEMEWNIIGDDIMKTITTDYNGKTVTIEYYINEQIVINKIEPALLTEYEATKEVEDWLELIEPCSGGCSDECSDTDCMEPYDCNVQDWI